MNWFKYLMLDFEIFLIALYVFSFDKSFAL